MFAEELSGNASRKRQQENRARRRQLKNEKEQHAAREVTGAPIRVTSNVDSPSENPVATSTTNNNMTGSLSSSSKPAVTLPTGHTTATGGHSVGKPAAVANAMQHRQLRQLNQLHKKSCIKIQSLMRSYLSNCQALDRFDSLLAKQLSDLAALQDLLQRKAPDSPLFLPPAATTSTVVRELLFLCRDIPFKRPPANKKAPPIKIRSKDYGSRLIDILQLVVIPGLKNKDDANNPLIPWLGCNEGRYRMQCLLRLCLQMAISKCVDLKCLDAISIFLQLILGVSTTQAMSQEAEAVIAPHCRALLINPNPSTRTMDLIQILRRYLLFTIGGSLPVPTNSVIAREHCISNDERARADVLFILALEMTRTIPLAEIRQKQEARFVTEILTIPLLTWKISPTSLGKLVAPIRFTGIPAVPTTPPTILFLGMIASFIELNKEELSLPGGIVPLLPIVEVPMPQCPATNTQCLLANLVALGKICVSLNGSDRTKIDYPTASLFYQFLTTLLDVVPLGTYLSRDSAVEWVTDGKGHHTPVVLSPAILDQCKLLLVESFVRNIFNCAIDAAELKVESVLRAKNEKDLNHEVDLKEAAGSAGSATALAAREARMEKDRAWLSSKWASRLKKGVSSFMSSTRSGGNSRSVDEDGGKGTFFETTPVSLELASGVHNDTSTKALRTTKEYASKVPATTTNSVSPYSPVLLFALCRVFSTVLSRWGGGGGKDEVVTGSGDGRTAEKATSKPDPCAMALLNVLCFGTDIVRVAWAITQTDKEIISDVHKVQKGSQAIVAVARPCFTTRKSCDGRMENDGLVVLYACVAALGHSLIITDDAEIYDVGRPLPVHQLRRMIRLLKKILCHACNVDGKRLDGKPNHFGIALVSASVKVMRDLYDRSARRPLCVPRLWLVDNLMVKEIQSCRSHSEYVALLLNPVFRLAPFLVSFKRRLKLFERIVSTSRIEIQGQNDVNPFNTNPLRPGIPVQIMRGRVLEDGLATLNKLGPNLRDRINVQYLNEAGARESGVDVGGLFKEFWTDLCAVAFDPNYALFRVTEDVHHCLYPNPSSGAAHGHDTHIVLFEFLGRILGKALYEGITIRPQFAHFFLSFLRGDYNYLHMLPDLSSVDEALYKNLMFLKSYEGVAEDLCLTFSIANDDFGGKDEVDLIPNGSNISVTNSNKQRYIGLVAKYHVNDRLKEQSEAFCKGLWDILEVSWLRIFNEPELQILISGATGETIDVDDMRANTRYIGGFSGMDPTINRFWKVVESLSTKQQGDLLRFVTSCERPPPLGFASMNPPFTIQRVGIMRDGDRLPTSSTCFNTLKLPTYSTEKVLRQRLIYAIESGAGFELA